MGSTITANLHVTSSTLMSRETRCDWPAAQTLDSSRSSSDVCIKRPLTIDLNRIQPKVLREPPPGSPNERPLESQTTKIHANGTSEAASGAAGQLAEDGASQTVEASAAQDKTEESRGQKLEPSGGGGDAVRKEAAEKGGQAEEEEDEDVREAKASIKCHLDRVKETELFLKSLKKDEEEYERQRQKMILFNDLMLGPKRLNGFRSAFGAQMTGLMMPLHAAASACTDDLEAAGGDSSYYRKNTGLRSAPVQASYHSSADEETSSCSQKVNGFLINSQAAHPSTSAALSFEPTFVLPVGPRHMANYAQLDAHNYTEPSVAMHSEDPLLEPVQPYCGAYSSNQAPMDRFRRSRSQLSDQFTDYRRRASRPSPMDGYSAAASVQSGGGSPLVAPSSGEIYYPSRAKRSVSQLRYSSNRLSQPVALSEYKSAYGYPSHQLSVHNKSREMSPARPEASQQRQQASNNTAHLGDDDDGMSAYRASSYVPRVVPSRAPEKRRSYLATSSNSGDGDRPSRSQRRSSLQSSYGTNHPVFSFAQESETNDTGSSRRQSMTSATNGDSKDASENSRLSELEQRIMENKRRREKLLAGKGSSPSPEPASGSETTSANDRENHGVRARRESSPAASPVRTSGGRLGRPSRLESMEARIKRKSYCVRVGDCSPDRPKGQMSLEKWRQSNQISASSSGASSAFQNKSDSLMMKSSDLALSGLNSKRSSSITGGSSEASNNEEDKS